MKTNDIFKSVAATTLAVVLGVSAVALAEDGNDAHSSKTIEAIGDAAITARIKTKYMDDTRLKGADIGVTTTNGTVTLTGTATGSEESNAAEDLARHVDGVKHVENKIFTPSIASKVEKSTKKVSKKTKRVVSDSWITTKVKSVLIADSVTKNLKISVKTMQHVVYLSGTVDSLSALDQAINLASHIDGVSSVDSVELKVVGK